MKANLKQYLVEYPVLGNTQDDVVNGLHHPEVHFCLKWFPIALQHITKGTSGNP
jgi:hypothetical protein